MTLTAMMKNVLLIRRYFYSFTLILFGFLENVDVGNLLSNKSEDYNFYYFFCVCMFFLLWVGIFCFLAFGLSIIQRLLEGWGEFWLGIW